MHIVADRVFADEPCWGLREGPKMVGTQERWVQTVFVIRGDAIAKHETDMGLASTFSEVTPLLMPSFGENTVAQLRECADDNRTDTYWRKRKQEIRQASTLKQDAITQAEQYHKARLRQSVFGPALIKQR